MVLRLATPGVVKDLEGRNVVVERDIVVESVS